MFARETSFDFTFSDEYDIIGVPSLHILTICCLSGEHCICYICSMYHFSCYLNISSGALLKMCFIYTLFFSRMVAVHLCVQEIQ